MPRFKHSELLDTLHHIAAEEEWLIAPPDEDDEVGGFYSEHIDLTDEEWEELLTFDLGIPSEETIH